MIESSYSISTQWFNGSYVFQSVVYCHLPSTIGQIEEENLSLVMCIDRQISFQKRKSSVSLQRCFLAVDETELSMSDNRINQLNSDYFSHRRKSFLSFVGGSVCRAKGVQIDYRIAVVVASLTEKLRLKWNIKENNHSDDANICVTHAVVKYTIRV